MEDSRVHCAGALCLRCLIEVRFCTHAAVRIGGPGLVTPLTVPARYAIWMSI